MKKINIALIGGGGFMGKAHSLAYAVAPILNDLGVSLVKHTLVDASAERAAKAAADFGWEHSSDSWQDVIADPNIDIIDIVTPPQFHKEIAVAAIRAGKAVFCEKPIANSEEDAREMAELAREYGVTAQVGFNYRHTPALTYLKKLIDEGELGEMMQFRASYLQDGHYFLDDFGWRGAKSTGGSGAVGDIGSHVIDIAEYLNGDIVRVCAQMRSNAGNAGQPWVDEQERSDRDLTDDAGTWLAEFANGSIGVFAVNFQAYGRKNRVAFELDATKGAAEFDWNRREVLKLGLATDSATQSGLKEIIVSEAHEDIWYPVAGIGLGYIESSAIQIKRFIASVIERTRPAPDFADALHVQQVVGAITESANAGRWVEVAARIA